MKRKLLVTILSLIMGLSIVACGKQETTVTTEPIVESTEVENAVTEETAVAETTTETEFIDDTTSDTSTSTGANETAEIDQSKWADINGAWDAVHQFTLYAREQGADDTDGWCWEYYNGKGAGDQPSYAVYMKEGSSDYGKVFHVGDYLPDGNQFCGTNDEWEAFIGEDLKRVYEDAGYEVTEEDGAYVIHLD